jgi:hypothetical protein
MRITSNRLVCLALCLCLLAVSGAAQQRNPLPVPDIQGYKTLKCDFHMHTVFSDGEVWPTTRVNEAWRQGLDAIAITDHAGYNPNKADVPPDLTRPHALASALAARLGILLAPAVEVMKGDTHFNVLFVSNQNAFMGLDLPDALREGRKQNGFIFWNHPGWKQPAAWFPDVAALYNEKLMDGVELVNGTSYYPQAFPWIEEKNLTILSNTDVHAPAPASWENGSRTVTLVFARTPDLEGIREALFARRTAAWMGGEVWGNEAQLRGLWDGAVAVETPELKFGPNLRQLTLRVRNNSSLRFQLRLTKAPAWLTAGAVELRPEGGAGISVRLNKDAPAGTQSVELEFEAANLHVAPNRNLSVRLPLKVVVAQ